VAPSIVGLYFAVTTTAMCGTLSGSFSPIVTGSNVDLTIAGKSDWVHWGLYSATSLNRKQGVTPQLSDFAPYSSSGGNIVIYQYADNYNGYTWYDGWPSMGVTNTTTGVWAYKGFPYTPMSTGFGFQLSAPADTTWRTLCVYVGAFQAQGQLKASLSDGGLAYTDTSLSNASNGPGGVYSLTYKANSPNQTLTVLWTLYQRASFSNSPDANVTLQAAALSVTNADNPPFVTLTSPADQLAFQAPATITCNAVAQDFDGTVTNVAFFNGSTLLGHQASAPYSWVWSNVPPGHYYLSAAATDNGGMVRSSPTAETFVYGSGGSLTGSVAGPPALVDLTAEGTNDWVHWGLTNTAVDRKSGVVPQLTNFVVLGNNGLQQVSDNAAAFSWSDGTPNLAATNTTTGIFITGITNGFMFTAPADLNLRRLRVYVGCYGAQGNFEAYLSDASAPPYIDNSTSSQNGNAYAMYELTYSAAAPNQQLQVVYRAANLFDWDYGNVTLEAASLAITGSVPTPPPTAVSIVTPQASGGNFALSFTSQNGYSYAVQYANSLPATNWNTLTNLTGTGGLLTVTDIRPGVGTRFYRVAAH
jgi:hypothetical protein